MCHVTWTYDTAMWRLIKIMCIDLLSSGEATKVHVLINWTESSLFFELSSQCCCRASYLLWSSTFDQTRRTACQVHRHSFSRFAGTKYANVLKGMWIWNSVSLAPNVWAAYLSAGIRPAPGRFQTYLHYAKCCFTYFAYRLLVLILLYLLWRMKCELIYKCLWVCNGTWSLCVLSINL